MRFERDKNKYVTNLILFISFQCFNFNATYFAFKTLSFYFPHPRRSLCTLIQNKQTKKRDHDEGQCSKMQESKKQT